MDAIHLDLQLPRNLFSSLRQEPEQFFREMRLAAAVKWYETERISQGKAAEIAGGAIPVLRFPTEMAEQRFSGTYSAPKSAFRGSGWPIKVLKPMRALQFDPNRKFGNAPDLRYLPGRVSSCTRFVWRDANSDKRRRTGAGSNP